MNVLVDTSVWSLALRRDTDRESPQLRALQRCLQGSDLLVTTGLILQELLQGFRGPKAKDLIVQKFTRLPFITPNMQDHIEAADLRNHCRRRGVQAGTIDSLIAQLCVRHELQLLTTDKDFCHIARHVPFQLLEAP